MKFIMSYSLDAEEKKHLLWCVFDDDENFNITKFKICEFRVCDCFLDWTIHYQSENKDAVFSEEVMTDFFDGIPTDVVNCDIFSLFGKITIVCCRNALFHFFYKEDLQHDKLSDECLAFDIDMRCMYMLEKKMFYSFLCSNCQFNFIKMISNRFITIKNDLISL